MLCSGGEEKLVKEVDAEMKIEKLKSKRRRKLREIKQDSTDAKAMKRLHERWAQSYASSA